MALHRLEDEEYLSLSKSARREGMEREGWIRVESGWTTTRHDSRAAVDATLERKSGVGLPPPDVGGACALRRRQSVPRDFRGTRRCNAPVWPTTISRPDACPISLPSLFRAGTSPTIVDKISSPTLPGKKRKEKKRIFVPPSDYFSKHFFDLENESMPIRLAIKLSLWFILNSLHWYLYLRKLLLYTCRT